MAQGNKATRLSKAARELNVGINTIVDFLSDKGIEIEGKPNTKIDEETYEILQDEFQSEKKDKEKSKMAGISKEERTTVSLEDEEVKDKPKEDDGSDEEILITNVSPDETVAEEKEDKKEESQEKKPNVVGKIDLESINQKTRPDKKPKKKEEKEEEEKPKEEEKTAKKEEPKKEEKAEKPEKESKKEDMHETKREKLSGPTVVGKINLPEKKKPIASSDEEQDTGKKKRKRKRIKKVDVDKEKGKGKKGKKGKDDKAEIDEKDIQKEIKETLARMSGSGKSKSAKLRRAKRDAVQQKLAEEEKQAEEDKSILKVTEFVTVSELASMMSVQPTEIISALMSLGIFASINQRLDAETLTIIAEEFGYQVEFVSAEVQESIKVEEDNPEDLEPRAPIVTVMGHVDHGKTSLLDYIRKENVIAGEAGGITQHIGAYSVSMDSGKKITFLDTPGHEAFTAMRARGAQVTDVAIIVIAADDNVMPQTKEAINHAQAAGVPMVFAINKIDKPGAQPDKIREELANMNILVEEWGGKYQCQEISAKQGLNIKELLEKVVLESEILELKANPNRKALGTVIESTLDKGRGYVTTLLVENGSMNVGDIILAGCFSGRVKAMFNERGKEIESVPPAHPVSMLGLNGAPNAGDKFHIMEDEREARNIATKRLQLQREQGLRTQKHITLDEIGRRLAIGDFQELNIIIKADVDGSIEALADSLLKLSTEKIQVNIIHKAVGQITESDVLLASASDGIILGFQVRPSAAARKLAEKEEIEIRMYSIIYKAIEEVKDAMEGMLAPDIEEKIVGSAEIRETFKITKVGTIAGCFVLEGKITRNNDVRVIRDGIVIYTGKLESLKRFKDDVKEVDKGYECGLNVEKFNDIKVGDIIESFEQVEVKQKL